MRGFSFLRGLICLGIVGAADAGVVLAPTSVSSPQGDLGGAFSLENIINQTGLSAGYVDGVTDFGSFLEETSHAGIAEASGFTATESIGPQQFTFDLGEAVTITGIAIWNTSSVGAISSFELHWDTDAEFANGTSGLLIGDTPLQTPGDPQFGQAFDFEPTSTRYVHINATSSLEPPDFFGLGEVVFDSADAKLPCPWDLDGDGMVGVADLIELVLDWGPNPGHPADFDGSGDVGTTDLVELILNWGLCP